MVEFLAAVGTTPEDTNIQEFTKVSETDWNVKTKVTLLLAIQTIWYDVLECFGKFIL